MFNFRTSITQKINLLFTITGLFLQIKLSNKLEILSNKINNLDEKKVSNN